MGIGTVYTTKDLIDSRRIKQDLISKGRIKKLLDIEDKTIVFVGQTHSINIAVIGDEIKDLYLDTDGFITKNKKLVLFTQYADCLPIYAYDKKNKVIGLCHAGWKGAFDGIQKNMIEKMISEYGSSVEDIIIGLGIGISVNNYLVGEEFFEAYYGRYGKVMTRLVFSIKSDRYYYDNIEFNKQILLTLGIREENIIISNSCTYRDEFHSYRRDGDLSGRNGAFIYFKEK
ncbi:polyphenol oxidase family protein [Psychrilyobacter sp.]|uniref:polyphenol oxidase family protein n=1 Tax=Psychrilyobacter sp. TaxID=2586924 RepID=UPI003018054C